MQRGGASVPRRRRRCRRCLIGVGVVIGRCNTGLFVLGRRDLGARCIGRTVAIWLVAIRPGVARTLLVGPLTVEPVGGCGVVAVGGLHRSAVAAGFAPAVAAGRLGVGQERRRP